MDKEWLIEDEPKNNKKKTIISSIFVVALLAIVVGISVALFTTSTTSGDNTLNTGRISMSYTEPSNALILENALPMTDEEGKAQTKYFEFTVATHATTNANDDTGITIPYEINISDLTIDGGYQQLTKSFVKVNLVTVSGTAETEVAAPTLLSNMMASTLREGATRVYKTSDTHKNNSATKTTTYRLRAWIDKSFDASTETTYQYKFSVNVNSQVNAVGVEYPEEPTLLRTAILGDNNSNVTTSGNGLYVSTATNDGRPTYYYRGLSVDNYVDLGLTKTEVLSSTCELKDEYVEKYPDVMQSYEAYEGSCYGNGPVGICVHPDGSYTGSTFSWDCADTYIDQPYEYSSVSETTKLFWRVVRINEDGTIKLILDNSIMDETEPYPTFDNSQYYSGNQDKIKGKVENWYATNLSNYDSIIENYNFCEAAKVLGESNYDGGGATMASPYDYQADFKCPMDGNGKQYVNAKVGLITVDEALMSGSGISNWMGDTIKESTGTYMPGGWTMSPAGASPEYPGAMVWLAGSNVHPDAVFFSYGFNPVINLKSNVIVIGEGNFGNPWVVQTN